MKVAVTGASGFIGGRVVRELEQSGHEVVRIGRKAKDGSSERYVTWREIEDGTAVANGALQDTDAIVHLAGETINQRWTQPAKSRILQSRVHTTELVARLVEGMERKPRVVVNGSGISIYGTSDTESLDETSPARITDFLASVVEQWEAAADRIRGTRLVKLRVGVVLGREGGAYPKMALPCRWGVGGRVGRGSQWLSWIHIQDMVRLILFCLEHGEIAGPVNATAPHPVMNDEFGRALAKALGRPHWMPVPAFAMKALFGEMAILLLEGQNVRPAKALEHGFRFEFPTLEAAVNDLK